MAFVKSSMLFILITAHAAQISAFSPDCLSSSAPDSCDGEPEKSSLLQTKINQPIGSAPSSREIPLPNDIGSHPPPQLVGISGGISGGDEEEEEPAEVSSREIPSPDDVNPPEYQYGEPDGSHPPPPQHDGIFGGDEEEEVPSEVSLREVPSLDDVNPPEYQYGELDGSDPPPQLVGNSGGAISGGDEEEEVPAKLVRGDQLFQRDEEDEVLAEVSLRDRVLRKGVQREEWRQDEATKGTSGGIEGSASEVRESGGEELPAVILGH